MREEKKKNLPYKYSELYRAAARPYHGLRAWNLMYLEKRPKPHIVWRQFLHGLELEWHGQISEIDYYIVTIQRKKKTERERITYNFKYLLIQFDTNISGGADLFLALDYRLQGFGSGGPRFNRHDLHLKNRSCLLSK